MKNVARLIVVNARERKRPSGTSGSGRLAMRIGKSDERDRRRPRATPRRACPATRARRRGSAPKDSPPTASAATIEPSQSNAGSSRCRATRRRGAGSTHSANARSGTLTRNAMRQPIGVDEQPADERADEGQRRTSPPPRCPNARPRSAPSNVWVMIDREPGTSSAPAAPWSKRGRGPANSRVGASPHKAGRDGEAGQADRVDPTAAVVVGQRAGQDEQGGEDGQVAADDVGLALEDADERGGQLASDAAAGPTFTIVPSRNTAPDPMIVATRVQRWRGVMLGSVADRLSRAMPGPVALVGAGEFLPAMTGVRRRVCWRRRASPSPRRRSCRPRRSPTARTSSSAGRRWASTHFAGARRGSRAGAGP